MLIYLINFLSIPVYSLIDKNRKRIVFIICFQLFLMLIFRSDTLGGDLKNYSVYYQVWSGYSFGEMVQATRLFLNQKVVWGLESGYVWFCWICAKACLPFHGFMVIHAMICMAGLYRFLKSYAINKPFVLVLMIAFGVHRTFFGALRQAIAFVILLSSIKAIQQRKIWRFLAILCGAVLFHRVTVPFIIVYFLYDFKITRRTFLAVYAVCIVLLVMMQPVYSMILEPLLKMAGKDDLYGIGNFTMNNMIVLMVLLSMFVMIMSNVKKVFVNGVYRIFFWAMALALVIETVSLYIPTFARGAITVYFPFAMVLVADIIDMQISRSNRVILTAALYMFLFVFYVYQLIGDYNMADSLVPYVSVFS